MSDWRPRGEYPSLQGAKYIAIDCETKDPNLEAMGPGSFRRDGYIVGVSICAWFDENTRFTNYYPVAHEGGDNLPANIVFKYLRNELSSNIPKIGANIGYDLEWLLTEGVVVGGPKLDIQIAEALIDENQDDYSLEHISTKYLGRGKDEALLKAAAASHGWTTAKQVKSNLWRLPARFVGPYAEFDAEGALDIFFAQRGILADDELENVFGLETRLVDALLDMRVRGIPISYDKAEQAIKRLNAEQAAAQVRLNNLVGGTVDVWSGQSLASSFDKLGLSYPVTPKGNPSFVAEWLEAQNNQLASDIVTVRKLDRSANVFIQRKIVDCSVKGRLHPLFRQTRREDGGTRSGRLASAAPNMQQVPSRHPVLAPAVRSVFIPDAGCQYGVFDYSQQEPRVTLHYALLRKFAGAEEALRRYQNNPRIDYHQMVADMAHEITGHAIGRKAAKTLNLGMAYGMGIYKLAAQLGLSVDEAKPVFNAYHAAVPYVRKLGDDAMRQAKRRGWIKTLMGRKRHFPGGDQAHKALNSAVQGSSADMIKLALVTLFEEGIRVYNTVHDEINCPIEYTRVGDDVIINMKQVRDINEILTGSLKLLVPLVTDFEVGPSWGEVKPCEV